jgi:hypothetical protein
MGIGGWRTRSVFERYNIVSQTDIQDALQKLERRQNDQLGERDAISGTISTIWVQSTPKVETRR